MLAAVAFCAALVHPAAPLLGSHTRRPAPHCILCSEAGDVLPSGQPTKASLPNREVDSRGFVVPQVGDVVKMPSKWPGEWDVAQVDFVQFIGSRGAYEVDLLPLKPIGENMFRMPGKKPASVTLDVAKLGRLPTVYVPERDAFRVNSADLEPLGGKKLPNPDVTAEGLAEYAELKAGLLREAAILGVAGVALANPVFGGDASFAFGIGTAAGCAYLLLLQKEADAYGSDQPMSRVVTALVGGRLGVPVVLFVFLAARQLSEGGQFSFGVVPKQEFAAAVLGFFSYKLPLLVRNLGKAFQELASNKDAQAPLEAGAMPTGSLGMAVRLAQSRIKSAEDKQGGTKGAAAVASASGAGLVVLCGPSGVGKSTLIARLLQDFPDRFGFSVSSTTRPPRAGEVAGTSYDFLTESQFDSMIADDLFVEWASVGGNRYGTSVQSVQAVSEAGKICLMDLDVQGVEVLAARSDGAVRPFCVWVAPPSLDALRARLRARGTELPEEVEKRISRATQEIEYSLSARCFDKILLNDDLEEAYDGLKAAIDQRLAP